MKYLFEGDRKKISKTIKKKIEISLSKKRKVDTTKLFDIWSTIATQVEEEFEGMYYTERAKPWGYNRAKIETFLYNNFIKENHSPYKKTIFKLLNLSKNKSIQSTGKDRKYPFKQEVFPDEINEGDWFAPPGTDVHYSDSKSEKNPYSISYFRKTKIPFFKGPKDQENQIIKNKWVNLYSFGFIYGYILSWQNFVHVNWNLKKKEKKFPDVSVKLTKKKVNIKVQDNFFKNLFIEYLKSQFKSTKKPEDIFLNIQSSIYDSKLTQYLKIKKHNYFTIFSNQFKRTIFGERYEQVGTSEFINGILENKELYLGKQESGRYFNTVYNTRFDARKNGFSGQVYNYEQFLMYTMSLEYFYPLDFIKLDIDEKDIFLRFAINRGKDEFLTYARAKIF